MKIRSLTKFVSVLAACTLGMGTKGHGCEALTAADISTLLTGQMLTKQVKGAPCNGDCAYQLAVPPFLKSKIKSLREAIGIPPKIPSGGFPVDQQRDTQCYYKITDKYLLSLSIVHKHKIGIWY